MSSHDRNLSMSFDFFKKKRKRKHSRSKQNGYSSSPPSVNSQSESFLNGSQSGRPTLSVTRRGTFRGILSDNATPGSQRSHSATQTQNEEPTDFVPDMPEIDLEACKPSNYITWVLSGNPQARDQMVFGNQKILSMVNLEQLFLSQLKVRHAESQEIEKTADSSHGIAKSVNAAILSRMREVYSSYTYLLENACQYCHFASAYLNSFVFLRPLNLTNFSFSHELSSGSEVDRLVNSVNIDGNVISGPVFVHDSLLAHFEKTCEYLPSKLCVCRQRRRCPGYRFKHTCVEYDYLPNLVTRVIHERALKQLIVAKSNVDIHSVDLSLLEVGAGSPQGYHIFNLKTGEKCWLPIYLCETLSHEGAVSVELPLYLTSQFLSQLRRDEARSELLQRLPNDYFFEVAHIFTKAKLL